MNTKVHPFVLLSTGRIVVHERQSNGSQLATPTPGSTVMTEAEWQEYCLLTREYRDTHQPTCAMVRPLTEFDSNRYFRKPKCTCVPAK